MDDQWKRIEAIVGEEPEDLGVAVERFCEHLKKHLVLPCEVTGIEDFRWEEFYVIGPGDPKEYARLKKTQPSYTDRYDLLAIETDDRSEWMMFRGDDIAAHVKRKADGKDFVLGLAELKATEKRSQNNRLLNDFAVFLVNSR
jgi:hypothetical protein